MAGYANIKSMSQCALAGAHICQLVACRKGDTMDPVYLLIISILKSIISSTVYSGPAVCKIAAREPLALGKKRVVSNGTGGVHVRHCGTGGQ